MTDRYESRADLLSKIEWEGGVIAALEYGIKTVDMPEGDTELEQAWRKLEDAWNALDPIVDTVEKLVEAGVVKPSQSFVDEVDTAGERLASGMNAVEDLLLAED
jgi:hypothetical protein